MITSTANAQVKALSKLIKNARARRQQQLYVVEGIRMFRETPKERIGKVYVSESFAKDPAHEGVFEGTDWEMLSDSVFAAVSDTKTPQGVLCLVKMKENRLEDMLEDTDGVWLVLENVQDPGNLGTMFRTGEGAGISGVIMDKCTVDIYNPKTIRSTMGSIFRVPFYITEDLHGTLGQLQEKGIQEPYADVLRELEQRDYDDTHRAIAPLKAAPDAVHIDTSELTLEQSIDAVCAAVRTRFGLEADT